jgi:hypothetical protein
MQPHQQLLQPDQRPHVAQVGLVRHLNPCSHRSAEQPSVGTGSSGQQRAHIPQGTL